MSATSTAAVPEGLALDTRNRHLVLALAEIAECQRDLAMAAMMPPSEHAVAKLAGVAAGLDRALARIRLDILNQEPPPPVPVDPITASEAEQEREIGRLRGWLNHIGEQAGATFIERMVTDALDTDAAPPDGLLPRHTPDQETKPQ